MKNFTLTFLFIFPIFGFGQEISEEFKKAFNKNLCNCIDSDQPFEECIENNLSNNFEGFCKELGLVTNELNEEEIYELVSNLMNSIMDEFVNDCDRFYNDFLIKTQNEMIIAKKDISEDDLSQINEEIESTPSSIAYFKRGYYFFFTNKINHAEEDLKKSLELDSNNYNSSIILGYIYEEKNQYDKAINIYSELYNKTKNHSFLIQRSIAKRKLKESLQN